MPEKSIRPPPPLLFSCVEKVKELGVIEKGNVFFFLPSSLSEECILIREGKNITRSHFFSKVKGVQ